MYETVSLEITTKVDASSEPVTPIEAKAYAKIETSEDDTLVTSLIKTARISCEKFAGITIPQKTLIARWNNFLAPQFIPYPPFISVVSVYEIDGTTSTLLVENTDYYIDGEKSPKLVIAQQITSSGWSKRGIKIEYKAGFTTIPEDIKTAIKKQVNFDYYNRGDDGGIVLCNAARAIMNNYKTFLF